VNDARPLRIPIQHRGHLVTARDDANEQMPLAASPDGPQEEIVDAEVLDAQPDESEEEEGDLISAELTSAQAELDEYRDTLQRLKAEFDNYKRRVLREQTVLIERASSHLIRELLPVLDSLEAALGTPDEASDKLREGLELVWDQLMSVLGHAGIERIADAGAEFDPRRHEAVLSTVAEEGPDTAVVEDVLRSGWALRGEVLRPAMVKVRQ
jgi:molecular chaperone GrpE